MGGITIYVKSIDKVLKYLDSVYPKFVSSKELAKICNEIPYKITYEMKKVDSAERMSEGNATKWRFKYAL